MEQIILILILALQVIKAIQGLRGERKHDTQIKKIGEGLSAALTDHAKLTVKGVTGAMGYYQGKGQKAAEGQLGELTGAMDQIKPLMEMFGGSGPGGKGEKKDGWL